MATNNDGELYSLLSLKGVTTGDYERTARIVSIGLYRLLGEGVWITNPRPSDNRWLCTEVAFCVMYTERVKLRKIFCHQAAQNFRSRTSPVSCRTVVVVTNNCMIFVPSWL